MATSLRLPNDIEARLTAWAAHTGLSKTFYILEAVSHSKNRYISYRAAT